MAWQMAPGTGYCEVDGELVFLDLARDKYLMLQGANRAAFERLRAGAPNDGEAMSRLVRTGLLAKGNGLASLNPAAVEVPARDLGEFDAPFSLGMALSAAAALLWACRSMQPHRLASTVEDLRASKRRIGVPGADAAARDVALRFAACRWIMPVPPRCLVDALALDHILLSRGLATSLVFGVLLHPFRAHCWLQTPEHVLTGSAAEARSFTPILVVA
jgi:hypothetical protein